MPGLLLQTPVGAKVLPDFGSSPVDDDPLFGDPQEDRLDPTSPTNPTLTGAFPEPDASGVYKFDTGEDPDATLTSSQGDQGINHLTEEEADRIARDPRYNTRLTPEQELRFQEWKQQNAPDDSGYDYDLKGAFLAGESRDPNNGHFDDKFKKPNHPTFSEFSNYAKDRPDLAGSWTGPNADQYVPASQAQQASGVFRYDTSDDPPEDTLTSSQGSDPRLDKLLGRGDTLLERMKDRFYTGNDFNIAMSIASHATDGMEMVGALLEGYGDDTLVGKLGAASRAEGKTISGYLRDKMDPEWVAAQNKSFLDFSENGALRDPKSYIQALSSQLPLIAQTVGLSAAAAGGLAMAGVGEGAATVGGWMLGGAVASGGDAASSAADAIDQAGLSPEQRRIAERSAGFWGSAAGLFTGPMLGAMFHGATGGLAGSLAVGLGEEVAEEGLTEAAAQRAKTQVGLPFDWKQVAEAAVQGGIVGGGLGGTVGLANRAADKADAKAAKAKLDSDAEAEAIRSQHEKERLDQAEAKAQDASTPPPPPGATPPGPPDPDGAQGVDFAAGADPSAKREADRTALLKHVLVLGHKMAQAEDKVRAAPDKAARAKQVGEYRELHRQMADVQAQLAVFPRRAETLPDTFDERGNPTAPVPPTNPDESGAGTQAGPMLALPAPGAEGAKPTELEVAKANAAANAQMQVLLQQVMGTSDPTLRHTLVERFRALRTQVQKTEVQADQGAPVDPSQPIDAQFRVLREGPPRLPGPTAREVVAGIETDEKGTLPKVALVPDEDPASIKARQEDYKRALAGQTEAAVRGAADLGARTVQGLQSRIEEVQKRIAAQQGQGKQVARGKLVGTLRTLARAHERASRELNDAIARRNALDQVGTRGTGPAQLAIPGLAGPQVETAGQHEGVDYAALARDLDRMMPATGADARPVLSQYPNPIGPTEPGPIAAVFDQWVKRSQAAHAGHATRAARRAQAEHSSAGQQEAQEGAPLPGTLTSSQGVKSDGTPTSNPPPVPAPLEDLPNADGAAGPTASLGAELQAVRGKLPSRRGPQVDQTPQTTPQEAQGAPPGPAQAPAAADTPPAPPGPVRGSNGPATLTRSQGVDPVEAEKARRTKPQTQEEFVDTATKMNETKAEVAQAAKEDPPARPGLVVPGDVEDKAEQQLPDPNSPPWKVAEDSDPPSTGVLQAAFQLEQQSQAETDKAARSPRNVLARLLADGPVRVDTVLAHLRENLKVDKGSNLDKLMQRLAGAFAGTTGRPTTVMVEAGDLGGEFQGLYDPKADTVHIDLQRAEDVLEALLHEVVHAATIGQIRINPKGVFARELTHLALKAKQYWAESNFTPGFNEVRGFQSLEEFISEALTNTWFQDQLQNLFDAHDEKAQRSVWSRLKSRLGVKLGFAQGMPEKRLFDALLEFVPDGDFLQNPENRDAVLAELDRLGLAHVAPLTFSTLNSLLRKRNTPVTSGLVAPRGRARDALVRYGSNYMLQTSYGKLGATFLNKVTGRVERLQDTVNRFLATKDQRGGYAAELQAKASRIVEVFKNAEAGDDEGRIAAVMLASRMYALDAAKPPNHPANAAGMARPGATAAYAELQGMWNDPKFTPAMRDTYELVRDHGDEIRYRMLSDLMVQRMRSLVGDTEADALLAYIASRAMVTSPTATARYPKIDIGYHPVLTAAEIDTQLAAVPALAADPARRKVVADALKEVHGVLQGTPGPYFPLRRYGDYYIALKSNPQTRVMSPAALDAMVAADRGPAGTGSLMIDKQKALGPGRIEVEWHHEESSSQDSEAESRAAHDEAKGKWDVAAQADGRVFIAKSALKRDKGFDAVGLKGTSIDNLRETLEKALGPGTGKMASDVAQQWFLDKSPATSVNKARMQARLVKGASKDMMRAYAEYAHGSAFLQAQLRYGPQMHRLLTQTLPADVKTMQEGDNPNQADDLTKLGNELQRREKAGMELRGAPGHGFLGKLWVKAPMLAAGYLLSGTATLVVNLLQPMMYTLPELHARFGLGKGALALARAYRDVALRGAWGGFKEGWRAFKKSPAAAKATFAGRSPPSIRDPQRSLVEQMTDHLPANDREAMKALAGRRQLDFGLTADLKGIAGGEKGAANALDYVLEAAFIAPQMVETMNRVTTGLATWRLQKRKMGLAPDASLAAGTMSDADFETLLAATTEVIKKTQVDYAQDNKSPVMQKDSLRAALVFKHFAAQQFYTTVRSITQGLLLQGETPERRAEARKFLGGFTTMTIAGAGLAGIIKFEPIYLAACAIMMALGDDQDEDPEAALRRAMADWNEDLRNILLKGVPYELGVDMGRMGMGQLFPVEDMFGLYQDPRTGQSDWYSMIAKTFMGAPGDILFKDIVGGAHKAFSDGEYRKGMEMMLPKMFGANDIMRAWNYAHSGQTTQRGETVVAPEEITVKDKIVRALGFAPSAITEKGLARQQGNFQGAVAVAKKRKLLDEFADVAQAGKPTVGIIQKIIQFNRQNPGDALTKDAILGAVKRREKDRIMLRTYGVKVRGKGDVLRARGNAGQYDPSMTGNPDMKSGSRIKVRQQLAGDDQSSFGDPSMLGIVANIQTMSNLHLKLGRSGKRSSNIVDLRKETHAISRLDNLDDVANYLATGLGLDDKTVAYNVKRWREDTPDERNAVLLGKEVLLNELAKQRGVDPNVDEPYYPETRMGKRLLPRDDFGDRVPSIGEMIKAGMGPPVPKSKPRGGAPR